MKTKITLHFYAKSTKMKGQSDEARSINGCLDMMRSKVLSAELQLIDKKEELSIENFQSILLDKAKNARTLVQVFQDHNNKMKELLGKQYAPGTLQRFEVTLNHLQNFLI